MGRAVQIIMLLLLLASLAVPCVMFYQQLPARNTGSRIRRFLLVELLLGTLFLIMLLVEKRSPSNPITFLLLLLVVTMAANIPAAIIAKIVSWCVKAKPVPSGRSVNDERPTTAMCNCPNCGRQVGVRFGSCPLCGTELPPEAEAEGSGPMIT